MSVSEQTLAAAVAGYLEAQGFEVFEEVTLSAEHKRHAEGGVLGDARADLVGRRGSEIIVVECKRAITFELLGQARRWRPFADHVAIAIACGKRSPGRLEALRAAEVLYGLGVFELGPYGLKVHARPVHFAPRQSEALAESLRPEQRRTGLAGTNRGGHHTSYKATCEKVRAFVADNPGCTLEEVVAGISHHYGSRKSALSSLRLRIRGGNVPGVVRGWRGRLWPPGSEPGAMRRETGT